MASSSSKGGGGGGAVRCLARGRPSAGEKRALCGSRLSQQRQLTTRPVTARHTGVLRPLSEAAAGLTEHRTGRARNTSRPLASRPTTAAGDGRAALGAAGRHQLRAAVHSLERLRRAAPTASLCASDEKQAGRAAGLAGGSRSGTSAVFTTGGARTGEAAPGREGGRPARGSGREARPGAHHLVVYVQEHGRRRLDRAPRPAPRHYEPDYWFNNKVGFAPVYLTNCAR